MKKFIRIAAVALALLLLTACGAAPQPTEEPKTPEQILAERRDIAEAMMRQEMTVLWRAGEDIVYSKDASSMGIDSDDADEIVQIVKGRVYQGLPYAHGSASVYSWLTFAEGQDSNGVYEISGIKSEMLSGGPNTTGFNRARLSNDCADSIFWAWAKVSSTIYFPGSGTMFDSMGCPKVGEYESVEVKEKDTKEICRQNGENVMFAAYAQLQKADAVSKSSHAMMIVEVHPVKNGDTFDPDQSYVTVLEQISPNLRGEKYYYNEQLQENVYICGGVDLKYTFRDLFDQGYLPITCKELIDPSPLAEETVTDTETNHTVDTIFTGIFQSSYRISSVTITIEDQNGNVVQQMTGYGVQAEMMRFRLKRLSTADEADVVQGSIDVGALPAGTYRCTHTCQISTGSVITVRDFKFTV